VYKSFGQNEPTPYSTRIWHRSPPTPTEAEKKSLTYEILSLFVQKLINPGLYKDYELTLKQFNTSLDFFERKISSSIHKVTKQINIDDDGKVPGEIKEDVNLQYKYCIEGGELFLDAIDEMRYYIDHVSDAGDTSHIEDCDWKSVEHLEEGLEIAGKADVKIRKSLEIFNHLYQNGY
jgi:hypothetical protein